MGKFRDHSLSLYAMYGMIGCNPPDLSANIRT